MKLITDNVFIASVLIFSWIEYLWELLLCLRQKKMYETILKVPDELKEILNQQTFDKARLYSLDGMRFRLVKQFYSIVMSSIVIYYGWFARLWKMGEAMAATLPLNPESEISVNFCFILIVNTLSTCMSLPFSIYHTFVLEERHGFNKQTVGFFIKDNIKGFVLGQFLTMPITSAIIYIVSSSGDMLVVWLWLFSTITVFLLITIYPSLIAPLFDKYSPLPEGNLRTSIEKLASSLTFPLAELYIVEGSKRSAHSNAYFYGLWKKRIVLFDTLLQKKVNEAGDADIIAADPVEDTKESHTKMGCTDEEILGILAHELGHWKCGHNLKNIVLVEANLLLMFIAFGLLFKYPVMYTALGFPVGEQPIIVGFIAVLQLVLAPYNTLLSFFQTILSRKFEFEADHFAVKLGFAEQLHTSLIKLNIDNLEFPVYDKYYSAWHHSHPTLLQRLEKIDKAD